MNAPEPAHAPARHQGWLNGDGRITVDVLCLHCRYNLRTLPLSGTCPECGKPVADSKPLSACSPPWLKRLRLGAMLLLLSLVAAAAAPPAYEYAVFLIFGPESSHWPQRVGETVRDNPPYPWTARIGLLVEQIPRAAALAALLLITTRQGLASRKHGLRSQRIARTLSHIVLVWLLAATAVGALTEIPLWATMTLMPGNLLQDMFCVAIVLSALSYAIHLSRRVPSPKLIVYARTLRWLCIPVALGWVVMDVAVTVVVSLGPLVVEAPYAFPVQVGPTTTTASVSARALEYIVVDETLAMTRTTTAPAYMLERWERYEAALKRSEPKLFSALDWYTAIRRCVIVPSAVWGLGALVLVALLWRTLHNVVKQQRAITAAGHDPSRP